MFYDRIFKNKYFTLINFKKLLPLREIALNLYLFAKRQDPQYIQANYDFIEGKINISEHKAITKKHIEEIKAFYDMHLELKPPKRLEKANDLYGKVMDHLLKITTFLQNYIDTDDIEKMARYLEQSTNEIDLANEYFLKAIEQLKKLTE